MPICQSGKSVTFSISVRRANNRKLTPDYHTQRGYQGPIYILHIVSTAVKNIIRKAYTSVDISSGVKGFFGGEAGGKSLTDRLVFPA